ncbi:MAG: CHASE2 domain-containing protein [Fusobacteriota bacterium]
MIKRESFSIGIIITIIISLSYFAYSNLQLSFFEIFELKSLDVRYKIRGEQKREDFEVVIIGIDEKSLNQIGKWPWARDIHGELVEKLSDMGAKSIGFDISFTEKAISDNLLDYKNDLKSIVLDGYKSKKIDRETAMVLAKKINELDLSEDYEFATKLRENPIVSIGTYNISKKEESILNKEILENDEYIKSRYVNINGLLNQIQEVGRTGKRSFNPEKVYKIMPPIEVLSKFAYGVGPYQIGTPDSDGVYRNIAIATLEEYTNLYFPPMYLLTYLKAFNMNMEENVILDLNEEAVKIYEDASSQRGLKLEIPIDKNGVQLLNFYGKGHTFEYISYYDILEDKVDKDKIKNKIVLVGYTDTAKGLYDSRPTPYDGNIPGVEIHATAIQNLIDQKYLRRITIGINIIILTIFGILLTLILSTKRFSFVITNILVVFLILIYMIFSQILFNYGIWIPVFYPIITYFGMYLILTVINYFGEELEKKKIKDAFNHYTNPKLIDELLKNPDKLKLGGERKEMTAFFSDIQGFTSISEKMDPTELVEFLNRYLSKMTDIILDNDGMVDKYEGDAIMAIFGAPLDLKDHALKCCYSALEYQKKLSKLRKIWKKEGLPEILVRIGINTGDMLVGNMGSENRFDYTAMGDEVNLASRLEGANKFYGTYIMISENTYEKVKDSVEVRELDIIRVKGKEKPVKVYELLSKKGELNSLDKKMLVYYKLGLKEYRNKNWDEAINNFKKGLEIKKGDSVLNLYINRCETFKKEPPDKDWDGVYTFTTK